MNKLVFRALSFPFSIPALYFILICFGLIQKLWGVFYPGFGYLVLCLIVINSARLANRLPDISILFSIRRVLFGILVFYLVFGVLIALRFMGLENQMVDLGNAHQAIYNTLSGRFLEATEVVTGINASRLGWHFEPLYIAIAPMLWLWDSALAFSLFQLIITGFGAHAIYLLAEAILSDKKWAGILSLTYLMYPAMQYSVLFDFHGDTLGITFLLYMMAFWYKKNYKFAACFALLALMCKEYLAFSVAGFGFVAALQEPRKAGGYVLIAAGAVWFLGVFYGIMPLFNQGEISPLVSRNFGEVGGSRGIGAILFSMFTGAPEFWGKIFTASNLENLIHLFLPLGFLSLFSPLVLLAGFPLWLKDLLYGLDVYNHHSDALIPLIFLSAIFSIRKFSHGIKKIQIKTPFILVTALCASFLIGPSPLGQRFYRELSKYEVTERDAFIISKLKGLPEEASISASGRLAPRLTSRRFLFTYPRPFNINEANYYVIDAKEQKYFSWCPQDAYFKRMRELELSDDFEKVHDEKGLLIYKKRL